MADKHPEKSQGKNFFERTATYTTKTAKRAQEKVKQKLGKSDETKDSTFDEFVNNFNKQQTAAHTLHKELKNYVACVKAMRAASFAFGEAVKEVYETAWSGHDQMYNLVDEIDIKWREVEEKLEVEVLAPMSSYQMQFPDIKKRIEKRGRKKVDYDRCRHTFEDLKSRGKSESKKAEEEFKKAKSVYTEMHTELYDELPALFDSRIAFYVSSFQSIFTAEGIFHRDAAKIKTQMSDLMDGLVEATSAGTYSTRKPCPLIDNSPSESEEQLPDSTTSAHVSYTGTSDETVYEVMDASQQPEIQPGTRNSSEFVSAMSVVASPENAPPVIPPPPASTQQRPVVPPLPANRPIIGPHPTNDVAETSSAHSIDMASVLYKVEATHPYEAEDDDELTFEKGEIVYVVAYDDPEDQDEGWLMGIAHSTGAKGVFPANFTRLIT